MVLSKFIDWQIKAYGLFIALNILLIVLGLSVAKDLGLDSDLKSLLPKNSEAVINSDIIGPKAGGGSDLLVMIYGGEFEDRVQAAQSFAAHVEGMENYARSVRYKTPKDFFELNKFLFIPIKSLESIEEQIEELRIENEGVTDPLGLEKVIREEKEKKTTQTKQKSSDEEREAQLERAKEMLSRLDEMRPFHMTEDGRYVAVRIVPMAEGLNIQKNKKLYEDFKKTVAAYDFSKISPEIKAEVYGGIERQIFRYESILADVGFGGWGVLAILIIVAFFFRSLYSWVVLIPPLLGGLAFGLAITEIIEDRFNLIAVFLVLVVFGVGIEFGVHLLSRFLQERQKLPLREALIETWKTTGRATITSAVALLTGFVLLTISSFQGFAQFGRVAVILLSTTAGAFLFFMPAWIACVEKLRKGRPWSASQADIIWKSCPESRGPNWRASMKVIRWTSGILLPIILLVCLFGLKFNYRFDEKVVVGKRSDAWSAQYNIFTERLKASAFALFNSQSRAYEFIKFYEANEKKYPEIVMVSGLATFYPDDQEERIEKLRSIADGFEVGWLKSWEDEQTKEALIEIKDTAYDYEAYSLSDVPTELKEPFIASDGSGDQLVFLFDRGGAADGRKAMRFSSAVDRLLEDFQGQVIVSGPEIIFADVVRRVTNEGPWLVLGMLLLVFLICWIDFRNMRDAAITVSPVLFGFLLTGALFVLMGGKINFYNMVGIASLGSMVVDNSIHLFHRYKSLKSARKATYAVSPTVVTCTLTSICGYAGMMFANHTGIQSLGNLAVLGLFCCLISAVLLFPAWLEPFSGVRHRAKPDSGAENNSQGKKENAELLLQKRS